MNIFDEHRLALAGARECGEYLEKAEARISQLEQLLRDARPWIGEAPYALVDRIDAVLTAETKSTVHSGGSAVPERQGIDVPVSRTTSETSAKPSSMDHGGTGQVGCERDDGLLNIHGENETCEVCSPETKAELCDWQYNMAHYYDHSVCENCGLLVKDHAKLPDGYTYARSTSKTGEKHGA